MRFARFQQNGQEGLAAEDNGGTLHGFLVGQPGFPGDLASLIAAGATALESAGSRLLEGPAIALDRVELLPPLPAPGKILCIGLNYTEHSRESGFEPPAYPTIFARFASSLIGHGAPIIRPRVSEQLDYEGELVAVIGRGGRNIAAADALGHVAGYSIFNDASIRDYQLRTPQWTVGKNFDATGAFGPVFVTADALPPGCRGLRLQTRLNGQVVQDAPIDDLIFDIATLVSLLSEAMTLAPGDVIITGTPSGVGLARKPPLWMRPGDICEVEVEGIGVLRNPILDEPR
ncbi:MAG TPA: fumarylacetoacetate hydrolase family protein [Devosiaceae bacterium]|nr:fumarylacetoacetate hydrolase family protein [Devosiaceae bacterium]